MKFKLVLHEASNKIKINSQSTFKGCTTLLPRNLNQHVHYDLPRGLLPLVEDRFHNLLKDRPEEEEIRDIRIHFEELVQRRKIIIEKMRRDINPKIIEICESLKEDYPEEFI